MTKQIMLLCLIVFGLLFAIEKKVCGQEGQSSVDVVDATGAKAEADDEGEDDGDGSGEVEEEEEGESENTDKKDEPIKDEAVSIPDHSGESVVDPDVISSSQAPTKERIFGSYRVRLSMGKPTFDDGWDYSEKLYGEPSFYPMFGVDWFLFDWFAVAGLGVKVGYYSDGGYMAEAPSGGKPATDDQVERDPESRTSLTLIPVQGVLTFQFTPFVGKYVVFDAWVGPEFYYWQEVVESSGESSTAAARLESSDSDRLMSSGWKTAYVFGGAMNILLNFLEPGAVRSLDKSMGFNSVFLTPFVEITRAIDQDGVSFGRTTLGLGFTFDGSR